MKLKDGRFFEQAVASEGCIIQVKGLRDIPFTEAEVESVEVRRGINSEVNEEGMPGGGRIVAQKPHGRLDSVAILP